MKLLEKKFAVVALSDSAHILERRNVKAVVL